MKAAKVKKPTREELEEEIMSLALTVKYLLEDVEYLLDNNGSDRKEAIRDYVNELKDFLTPKK